MIESKIKYLEELQRLGEVLGSTTALEGLKIGDRLAKLCDSIEEDLGNGKKFNETITVNVNCEMPTDANAVLKMFDHVKSVRQSE